MSTGGHVLLQDSHGHIAQAEFDQSIFQFFGMPANVFSFTSHVAVHPTEKKIVLLHQDHYGIGSVGDENGNRENELMKSGYHIERSVPLGRALKCAMYDFHLWPQEERMRVVQELNQVRINRNQIPIRYCSLAVSVLIENEVTGRVLITRRARHMRSFPCVWVTPGGSIEDGDASLLATAQREVKEETGIDVDLDHIEMYCMWESVFPRYLSIGTPSHHHLILYYRALVHIEDETRVVMQEEEVDAFAWLDHIFVQQLLAQESDARFTAFENVKCDDASHEPTIMEKQMHISCLSDINALERVSEGTNFVLAQWCQRKTGKSIVSRLNQ